MPERPQRRGGRVPLVGREQQRIALESWLAALAGDRQPNAAERPALVVLEGEAGIGKTTLWRHGCAVAAGHDLTVLVARPAPADLALGGLSDLLGDVLAEVQPQLSAPLARALDVALLRVPAPIEPPDQRAVAMGLRRVLQLLAARSPVLLAVDDMQWLDTSSAGALAFALRRLAGVPVGLLATLRHGDEPPLDLVATFPRRQNLALGPLRIDELQALVGTHLGVMLRLPALRRLHAVSGGNPFVALEIAASADPAEWPEAALPPAPDRLLSSARRRLSALPPSVQPVLAAAALLAAPTATVLEDALGGDALRHLQTAAAAGLVTIAGDRVGFTHPLLRAAAAEGAVGVAGRRLHAHLAAAVTDPEERARHLAQATARPDADVAAEVAAAGDHAGRRGAPEAAAALAELAVRLTPVGNVQVARERTLAAARHHLHAGDPWRAKGLLLGLVDLAVAGLERARLLSELGLVQYLTGAAVAARATLAQGLAEAGEDRPLRAELLARLAVPVLVMGDVAAAAAHAEEAVRLAHAAGAEAIEAEAAGVALLAGLVAGAGLRPDLLDRVRELEQRVRVRADAHPRALLGVARLYSDALDEARANLEHVRAEAQRQGDVIALHDLVNGLAEVELRAGRWQRAAALADEALDSARDVGATVAVPLIRFRRALIWAHRGDLDAAEAEAGAALQEAAAAELHGFAALCCWALGFVALSRGDVAAAQAHMGPLGEALVAMGVGEPGLVRFVPDEVEALVALGRLEEAAALLAPFAARSQELDRVWGLATAARCRGLLTAAAGDLQGALAHLAEARAHHDRIAEPFELARTLLVTGAVGRRARLKQAPRADLTEALRIFTQLGAPQWAQRTRAELASVSGRPPPPLELTSTERRVAELAAGGASNREIAAALFVSIRTVEAHLTRVYRKLGIRSRSQVAAALAAKPAGSPDSTAVVAP